MIYLVWGKNPVWPVFPIDFRTSRNAEQAIAIAPVKSRALLLPQRMAAQRSVALLVGQQGKDVLANIGVEHNQEQHVCC